MGACGGGAVVSGSMAAQLLAALLISLAAADAGLPPADLRPTDPSVLAADVMLAAADFGVPSVEESTTTAAEDLDALNLQNATTLSLSELPVPLAVTVAPGHDYSLSAITSWLSHVRDVVSDTIWYADKALPDTNSSSTNVTSRRNYDRKIHDPNNLFLSNSLEPPPFRLFDYEDDVMDFIRVHGLSAIPENFILRKLYSGTELDDESPSDILDLANEAELNSIMKIKTNTLTDQELQRLHDPHQDIYMWDTETKLSVSPEEVHNSSAQNGHRKSHTDEIRDLALKKWLKSASQVVGSDEKDVESVAELSYKILSQIDPEEESKDEMNDIEIFKAVITSIAAYQIRVLRKQLSRGRSKRDEEMVCYKDLGCFRDDGAFDYLDVLPSPPEEINTTYLLFTRDNPSDAQVLLPANGTALALSHFDAAKPSKVIVHGFGSSCARVWVREMRVALLTMVDCNLICVDWEQGATTPNYMRAASNTRLVGRQVAAMIEQLTATTNASLDSFHLIGFSLGAHVSGHAGKQIKLKRISGLDPAGPLFENFPSSVRLDSGDAEFVDVIHTNADSLLWGGLGAYEPMGHVDFYPNGGRMQKGCANLFVGGVSDILWPTEGDGRSLCNHRRGYKYFVESIAPVCRFPSFICKDFETFLTGNCFPCKECGSMGYYSDQAAGRGTLYLVTRDSEPFCANQYKVLMESSGGLSLYDDVSTYGQIDVTFVGQAGVNETMPLTRKDDQEIKAGSQLLRIMVPHPAITGIRRIQITYTAYEGWLSSGSVRWAINKVSLLNSFGEKSSFCQVGLTLLSGIPTTLDLEDGDCVLDYTPWRHHYQNGPDDVSSIGNNETKTWTEGEVNSGTPFSEESATREETVQSIGSNIEQFVAEDNHNLHPKINFESKIHSVSSTKKYTNNMENPLENLGVAKQHPSASFSITIPSSLSNLNKHNNETTGHKESHAGASTVRNSTNTTVLHESDSSAPNFLAHNSSMQVWSFEKHDHTTNKTKSTPPTPAQEPDESTALEQPVLQKSWEGNGNNTLIESKPMKLEDNAHGASDMRIMSKKSRNFARV